MVTYIQSILVGFVFMLAGYLLKSLMDIGGDNERPSSIWCVRDIRGNKRCQLKNVCLNMSTGEIFFYLNNASSLFGLETHYDFHTIQLSSVQNHRLFYANVSLINNKSMPTYGNKVIDKAIALARLKPDNVMHVVHDDLLPLIGTMSHLCGGQLENCYQRYHLLFLDDHDLGPYGYMYETFSDYPIFVKSSMTKLICFKELNLGVDLESIWYDYGFARPRGPAKKIYMQAPFIRTFKQHMIKRLRLPLIDNNRTGIILYRTQSRKILNIAKVLEIVKDVKPGNIETWESLPVSQENSKELLIKCVNANAVIGVHGAEMIFPLLMPQNSLVIEIIPFGLHPDLISFLKPLADYNVSAFRYFSWTNDNRHLSIPPPYDSHYLQGGLGHLSEEEQKRIKSLKKIKEVFCCQDPAFLYFMYQDTVIDHRFIDLLQTTKSTVDIQEITIKQWLHPKKVDGSCNIFCDYLRITWTTPSNVGELDVLYNVTLQLDDAVYEYTTGDNKLIITHSHVTSAFVWISAVLQVNQRPGPDSFFKCHRVNG